MGTEEDEVIQILSSQVLQKIMPMVEDQDESYGESYSHEVSSFDPNERRNSRPANIN